MEFKDWRNPTTAELDQLREEREKSDVVVLAKMLLNANIEFMIIHHPAECEFEGSSEIIINNRIGISFGFSSTGNLRNIINYRPKPEPEPLAGAVALKK